MLQAFFTLNVFGFFLIFSRIGTAFLLLPGFSASFVSPRMRLVFALAVTFVVAPVLATSLPGLPETPAGLGLLVIGEVVVGALLGTVGGVLMGAWLLVVVGGGGAFGLSNTAAVYASRSRGGIGSWLYVPTLLSMTMDLVGRDPKGVALVWGSLITVSGFGMFLSPIVVGFIRDLTGSFLPGFYICAVAALSLLLAGILMPRTQPITGAA